MKSIAVIDALDGAIGSSIIRAVRRVVAGNTEIYALGTNANATTRMVKSGADHGATGEGAICAGVRKAGLILGPISIIICYSMMGEITPRMVDAVGQAPARKILLPITDKPVRVVGVQFGDSPKLIRKLVLEHMASTDWGMKRLVAVQAAPPAEPNRATREGRAPAGTRGTEY